MLVLRLSEGKEAVDLKIFEVTLRLQVSAENAIDVLEKYDVGELKPGADVREISLAVKEVV